MRKITSSARGWFVETTIGIVCTLAPLGSVVHAADAEVAMLVRQEIGKLLGISTDGVHLVPLSSPIALPSTNDASDTATILGQFERIPANSRETFFANDQSTLLDALKKLDENIEIKAPDLSASDRRAISDAQSLLYVDDLHLIKTDAYKNYLRYEQKFKDNAAALARASSSAERSGLLLEQRSISRDWDAIGQREQLSVAVRTIQLSSPESVKALKFSWEATLTPEGVGDYSAFWDQIASLNDWTSVSMTTAATQLEHATLRYGDSAAQAKESDVIEDLIQIAFKVRLFKIPRRALDHAFLRSSNWQNTKSYVLSNGSAKVNPENKDNVRDKASSPELAPRYVAALVLIKGLELRFNSTAKWRNLASLIQSNRYVEYGGLPIKVSAQAPPFTSPNYLAVLSPYIFEVVVRDVPKIPNPNPSDQWPIRW
jgi:hypothetical protein